MRLFVKALLLWGIADSVFLARNPKGWERFWSANMDKITDSRGISRGLAGAQMMLCVWLLRKI